jgi:xylulose-5-phosphate/fructose-6-phosphate phosphoketolase
VTGPGYRGPGHVASAYLDCAYSEVYPHIGHDGEGRRRLSGYSLHHAHGAVLDNPDLVAVCVVWDGEAETGPLAASWHSSKAGGWPSGAARRRCGPGLPA